MELGRTPRSLALTDRETVVIPTGSNSRLTPARHLQNRRHFLLYAGARVFFVASVRLIMVKMGLDHGLRAELWAYGKTYCDSGVLAWTPVGNKWDQDTSSSDASLECESFNNNHGRRRRAAGGLAPKAFSERDGHQNGKRDEVRCGTCTLVH